MTKTKDSFFSIEVKIGDKTYRGSGKTALEALQTLEKPLKIFQKGIVTLTHGETKRVMLLMPQRIKRLWWKLAQPVLAKDFEKGLLGLK